MSDAWRRRLRAVGDTLLDIEAGHGEWANAALGLHALCTEITGLDEAAALAGVDEDTTLSSGLALSPRAAARSVDDFLRTARFVQGLGAAVAEAQPRFGSPVDVVYAGCGPFAPLCLPLAARLPAGSLRLTLVDVHGPSLRLAERVVDACGLRPTVARLEQADATEYRHDRPIQVAITETMGQALEREPQATITARLAPQLAPGGLMVPERVRVDACLADPAREFATDGPPPERPRIRLGTVLDLTAGTAAAVASAANEATLRIPALGVADPAHFMLRTAVRVLGRLELGDYESGITYPVFRHDLGRLRPGQSVRVAYRTGRTPRFECRLV